MDGFEWSQYALIAYLSEKMLESNSQFGKTALQKIVYILQEVYKVRCRYRFSLYSYGPYCSELPADLDAVSSMEGVDVVPVVTGYGGFHIKPGAKCDLVKGQGKAFIAEYKKQIDDVIDTFGKFSARELELRATIIFCCKGMADNGKPASKTELYKTVQQIKPKFPETEIKEAISELFAKNACSIN